MSLEDHLRNFLEKTGSMVRLTEKGILFHDFVASEII